MSSFRIDRISEEVRHAIDAIIRDMNDPRISGTYAVTRADVTRDLRWAKVYVSVLEDDKADDMIKALKRPPGSSATNWGRGWTCAIPPSFCLNGTATSPTARISPRC